MRTPPPVLPPQDESVPRYKTTWLDGGGPDASIRLKAAVWGVMGFLVMLLIWGLVAKQQGLSGWKAIAVMVSGAAASGYLMYRVPLIFSGSAAAVAKAVTLPSGSSTPYEEQFSYQESMAARGDIAGALESFEAIIEERPGAIAPRQRAAELYSKGARDPMRAAELFRQIRDLETATPRDRRYASTRLVDLYDGPLADPGRAVVELRRLIEHWPGSVEANHARDALPRLKARLVAERAEG